MIRKKFADRLRSRYRYSIFEIRPNAQHRNGHRNPNRTSGVIFLLFLVFFLGCAPFEDGYSKITNFYTASGTNLICFGDSLTSGEDAGQGGDYPSLLRAELDIPVINAGQRGDTTSSALFRLEKDVLEKDPRIVIVELGGNDFMQGAGQKYKQTFKNLEIIVDRIHERGAVVVIAGLSVSRIYRKEYEKLVKKKKCLYVPDIMGGILDVPGMMMPDNIHPNAKGYQLMAQKFLKVLKPALSAMKQI